MTETSSQSKIPLILAILGAVGLIFLSSQSYIQLFAQRYLKLTVNGIQAFALIIYLLMLYRFYEHERAIKSFEPGQGFGSFVGNFGGPMASLGGEYVQIFISLRISRLMFTGISLNEWDHGLEGLDFWLVIIVVTLIAVYALITVYNRTRQLTQNWGDIGEIIPD